MTDRRESFLAGQIIEVEDLLSELGIHKEFFKEDV